MVTLHVTLAGADGHIVTLAGSVAHAGVRVAGWHDGCIDICEPQSRGDWGMNMYHNIESTRWNGYRVGYAASNGNAVRIYGDSRTGYRVDGRVYDTLRAVSAYLASI